MTEPDLSVFRRKLAERRAQQMAQEAEQKKDETPSEFSDLIPEDDTSYERSEDDVAIDRLIQGITVDAAYDRWIRKPRPQERSGKREGVMISCPMPNHADRNPSAWMNLDKNTWFCAACDTGGDVLDLAAIKFGIPDYKSGYNFKELREAIAEDFGFTRIHAPGLPREGALVAPAEEDIQSTPVVPTPPSPPVPVASGHASQSSSVGETEAPVDDDSSGRAPATVTYLPEGLAAEDDETDEVLPGLDWRKLVTPGTFLDTYMSICSVDDVPEEYHFWNGLLALGLAVGRDVTLDDYHPVLANLFVCTLGRTGAGKSRSSGYLTRLLDEALPEDKSDPADRGARSLSTAGSAEVLIRSFSKPQYNPPAPGKKPTIIGYAPVRGLIDYSELSGLVGRAGRVGSTLKPTLMEFFDGKPRVSNTSLSGGEHIAELPFASLLTSTQPKALEDLLEQSDANSGFLNRWVFVTGTDKKRVAVGGVRVNLMPAVLKLREVHTWAEPDPITGATVVEWSPEALSMFTIFFEEHIERIKRGDDPHDEREFYQRLDLIMKKIILLFTINEMQLQVPTSAVEKAIDVFWYLVRVLAIAESSVGQSQANKLDKEILALVRKYQEKHGKDTACPIYYVTKVLGKKKIYTSAQVERALQTLTNLNMLVLDKTVSGGKGRPPSPRYRLATHE